MTNSQLRLLLTLTSLAALVWNSPLARAAQTGAEFPTHRYPTDRSFHLDYKFGYTGTSANRADSTTTVPLDGSKAIRVFSHEFGLEYEPNRKLSFGGIFRIDSVSLLSGSDAGASKSALGDQRVFLEYRYYDVPGASLGTAFVAKFPGYSNPTASEAAAATTGTVLLGDAQIDFLAALTSEVWISDTTRFRGDLGYMLRTQGFPAELPFMLSIGFVTSRIDLDLKLKGNLPIVGQNDDVGIATVRKSFANSMYAYSPSPWVISAGPSVELWMKPNFAVTFEYTASLIGNQSPYSQEIKGGLVYRWAETKAKRSRTFQDIDFGVDQEAGKFSGDKNDEAPNSTPDGNPIEEQSAP